MTPEERRERRRANNRACYHRNKGRLYGLPAERQRFTRQMTPQERADAWLALHYPEQVSLISAPLRCRYTGLELAYTRKRAEPDRRTGLLPDAEPVLRETPYGYAEIVSALANRQLRHKNM